MGELNNASQEAAKNNLGAFWFGGAGRPEKMDVSAFHVPDARDRIGAAVAVVEMAVGAIVGGGGGRLPDWRLAMTRRRYSDDAHQ
jgi:hypothetical protein